MSKPVIVVVADQTYLPHAQALMVNCRRQGNWQGDFLLLCPRDCDTSKIENRGIVVAQAPEEHWTNAIKFRLFTQALYDPWGWDQLLYLDCDVLIQGDLNAVCGKLSGRLPKIFCDGTQAIPVAAGGTTILQDWEHFDKLSTGQTHLEVYERMRRQYPHVDQPLLTSDAMFFAPASIPAGTVEVLFAAQERFKEANPRSYDQQVINLVLYDRLAAMGKDYVTWFAFDDPGNRVADPARGWRGDEAPAILHYWGMYAPWLVKTPDAGAYYNHRLGRVCRELYAENLSLFNATFPRIP